MGFQVVGTSFKPPLQYWLEYISDRGLRPEALQAADVHFLDIKTAAAQYGNWLSFNGAIGVAVIPADGNPKCDHKKFRIFYGPSPEVPPIRQKKLAKYKREFGHVNSLYVPPIVTDWHSTEYDLIIVEAELGALRLAQDGYHAVAIGGVENFRTGDKLTSMIPELRRLVERKGTRSVIIMHDSDVAERPKLEISLNRLAMEVARVRPDKSSSVFICLPKGKTNGDKNGPDDYLQAVGIDEFNRLIREEKRAFDDHPELQQEMRWVERVIYNRSSGMYYDNEIKKEVKDYHIDSNMAQGSELVGLNGKLILYNHRNYVRSPKARIADGLRYNPNTEDEYFLDHRDGRHYINLYNPEDIPKPVKGDVSIFYRVLENLCPNQPIAQQKILITAAKHVQDPCTTPLYGILLVGEQGAGKTLLAQAIGHSISRRYHCDKVDLTSGFNSSWRGYACKEWPEFDKNMDAEWLKDLITAKTVEVNAKFQQPYSIDNYTLNIFTANHMKAVIQEGDRRMIISGWGKKMDPKLGAEFYEWVNGPGPSYLRHHLLYDVSTMEYSSMGTLTEMRDDVIAASKSYKSSVADLIIEEMEMVEGLECIPNSILESLLEKYRVQLLSFNKEFAHIFIKPAKEVVKIDGVAMRFRAFKNHEKWRHEVATDEYKIQVKLAEILIKNRKF